MADRAARGGQGGGPGDRDPGPRRAEGARLPGAAARGQGQRPPAAHGHPPPRPPQGLQETLALVGKGITFDTGGISLKPGEHMWEMKGDMAGAAAVLLRHARARAASRPTSRWWGSCAAPRTSPTPTRSAPATSSPPRTASRSWSTTPTPRAGSSSPTACYRAGEEGATHVVDIATLTGACLRALGPSVAGVMGTDRDLIRRVIRSGENHGEAFWELPLVEEYRDALKTPFADINNIAAGGLAGAITAGAVPARVRPRKAWPGPTSTSPAQCSATRTGSTTRPVPWASA